MLGVLESRALQSNDTMFLFTKRPGQRASFRFMPGCLLMSLALSLGLTVLANVLIRLF